MEKQLYIAYGSNLNIAQMEYRCPDAKVVAKSWLHGYQLVFQGYPVGAHANVIPAEGHDVPVVIWEISPSDELNLDRYEGVKGGYYTKEYMTIECNGEMKEALIYIMAPRPYGIPDDYYLGVIAQGYKDFTLPVSILNDAVHHAYDMNRKRQIAAKYGLKPAT